MNGDAAATTASAPETRKAQKKKVANFPMNLEHISATCYFGVYFTQKLTIGALHYNKATEQAQRRISRLATRKPSKYEVQQCTSLKKTKAYQEPAQLWNIFACQERCALICKAKQITSKLRNEGEYVN